MVSRGVFHETAISEIALFSLNTSLENTNPISQNKIALFGGSVFKAFWANSNQYGGICSCRSSFEKVFKVTAHFL